MTLQRKSQSEESTLLRVCSPLLLSRWNHLRFHFLSTSLCFFFIQSSASLQFQKQPEPQINGLPTSSFIKVQRNEDEEIGGKEEEEESLSREKVLSCSLSPLYRVEERKRLSTRTSMAFLSPISSHALLVTVVQVVSAR